MQLFLENALEIVKACEEKAKSIGVPVVITVVDQGGNIVVIHRMDNAPVGCVEISLGKAYTAAALKAPTHELASLCQPGQELYGLHTLNGGSFVVFGGGYPLVVEDEVIGALGVSGGTVEQDMQVAQAGLELFTRGGKMGE